MPQYDYKARDRRGKLVDGVIEAEGPALVAGQLDNLGYFPVSIRERKKTWTTDLSLKGLIGRFQRIKNEDFVLFNRQLSTLTSAGLSLIRALHATEEQTKSARLRRILQQVRFDVESGSSFSEALARHPSDFSDLYVNMVRAGEEGGILDRVLERLALLAEQETVIRARIKAAVRYPLLVVAALAVAIFILMKLVVPQFVTVYERFGGDLPLPTRMLIASNGIFQKYWMIILLALALAVFAARSFINTPRGRQVWDGVKIRVPIFGPLFLKAAMSRFARVFSSLLMSGIPILRTLEIASGTVGNVVLRDVILSIRESVQEGESLAGPMRAGRVFPPVVVQMIAVGEETGRLDEMLEKVAEYYDTDVEYAIKNLTTALEPLLILVIGGVVLFLALAIFMPWWNVITFIRR